MAKNKIVIPDALKKDLKKYAENVAKNMAKSVRDDISKEYQTVVSQFYSEYKPKYYFRWDELWDTYSPYYHNSSPNFYGGIMIKNNLSPELYQDYRGAFSSYLRGYHGHPSLGIYSKVNPLEHMYKYRDSIVANIDFYNKKAINEARKDSYSILEF